jgi:predicted nucleic acid-binding protein
LADSNPKHYWDACIWITLIQDRDSARGRCCEHVLELAKSGKCEIWTSSFCLAEVYKRKCDGVQAGLQDEKDQYFEDLIEQEFIKKISVDVDVAKVARRLLRRFPRIGKPQDGVHVASCILENLDELHTFDREDLLALDRQIDRLDRGKLKICAPPYPPIDDQGEMFVDQGE